MLLSLPLLIALFRFTSMSRVFDGQNHPTKRTKLLCATSTVRKEWHVGLVAWHTWAPSILYVRVNRVDQPKLERKGFSNRGYGGKDHFNLKRIWRHTMTCYCASIFGLTQQHLLLFVTNRRKCAPRRQRLKKCC